VGGDRIRREQIFAGLKGGGAIPYESLKPARRYTPAGSPRGGSLRVTCPRLPALVS
jgi:hypothetical protein